VLTYREMMDRTARVLGRRRPLVVKVPVLRPRLSSYRVTLVTPDDPFGFDDAVRAAVG
jgi:hypothetical protein